MLFLVHCALCAAGSVVLALRLNPSSLIPQNQTLNHKSPLPQTLPRLPNPKPEALATPNTSGCPPPILILAVLNRNILGGIVILLRAGSRRENIPTTTLYPDVLNPAPPRFPACGVEGLWDEVCLRLLEFMGQGEGLRGLRVRGVYTVWGLGSEFRLYKVPDPLRVTRFRGGCRLRGQIGMTDPKPPKNARLITKASPKPPTLNPTP